MAYLNGVKVNNSQLINQDLINLYESAGVDMKTRQPTKQAAKPFGFKAANKKLLRINDEQCAVNSIAWYNLPYGIDNILVERVLFYKGQGMLFYLEGPDKFFFLPYALGSKGIDMYGRFINVTPLPFNGSTSDTDEEVAKPWIQGLEFDVIYDLPKADHVFTKEDLNGKCILISDYSKQISQQVISRQLLNDPLIDLEADLLPFARTALLNSTGVQGMRVQGTDEYSNVLAANKMVDAAALAGSRFIPIVGQVDFQELASKGPITNADQFLMTMQSIDNYRLMQHGVDSGGIFQKQAHMLESENEMNAGKSCFAMQDRLANRQQACDLANAWWGIGMWADASQPAIGVDKDMDGDLYEDKQEGTYSESPLEGGQEDGSVSES